MTDNLAEATKQCNVVMKGGITSGVVFQLALVELARTYRFRNIGGASAGAIAAAAAAAAELGRERGGFDALAGLPDFLAKEVRPGESRLFTLFQPQRGTLAVFRTLSAALRGGQGAVFRVVVAGLRNFPAAATAGSLLGFVLVAIAMLVKMGIWAVILGLIGIVVTAIGAILAVAFALAMTSFRAIPENQYGLCSGMSGDNRKAGPAALTTWLADYLDQLAGRSPEGPPLTFGDLWRCETEAPATDRLINLEMMTTCISHGRPYRLPFRNDVDVHEDHFYFSPTDFKRLFPARIVKWLKEHPRTPEGRPDEVALPKNSDLLPLPRAQDLPVGSQKDGTLLSQNLSPHVPPGLSAPSACPNSSSSV